MVEWQTVIGTADLRRPVFVTYTITTDVMHTTYLFHQTGSTGTKKKTRQLT